MFFRVSPIENADTANDPVFDAYGDAEAHALTQPSAETVYGIWQIDPDSEDEDEEVALMTLVFDYRIFIENPG